jgi:two-component system, OmpR family, sensor histidine kinase KdpD
VLRLAMRLVGTLAGVFLVTLIAHSLIPVNATTVAFAYLLLVLVIASWWGFIEAALASVASAGLFNFFFLPPIGTFAIADPQNWVALISFLATSLIVSRLSAKAERRALDAIARQQDIERLYTFSRSILLIDRSEPFPKQLTRKLAEIFEVNSVVLYDRRSTEIYRAGPSDFEGLEDQLRDAATHGSSFSDTGRNRVITAVRLGSEPIASLALQGVQMQDSVLQAIANLVAIGLERARAQDVEHQFEAARQSEQLRTTLIDAMAHEFKTPLTSIKAATSALLANDGHSSESRTELLQIAEEEAEHLQQLIDDAIEMARLDTAQIEVHPERSDLVEVAREVAAAMQASSEGRPVEIVCSEPLLPAAFDRRLVKLALKQLVDNALKYSPPGTPVTLYAHDGEGAVVVEITDHGKGIPAQEQSHIFERFYRSASVKRQVPGSGLGLSIAHSIVKAHGGDLTVRSRPGETTFRMTLPVEHKGGSA